MERCPNCSARSDGSPSCRRCGMELGGLIEIERAAERLTVRAMESLMAGDHAGAKADLERALSLRDSALCARLLRYVASQLAGSGESVAEVAPEPPQRTGRWVDVMP